MPKHNKKHNESSEGEVEGDANVNAQAMFANAIANNPALMQAVQDKLNGLVGKSSGYIESLPEPVKKRVNYLKNLQVEYVNIEGKFYQEVHALEAKYSGLFKPIYEKRKAVIAGEYEPTEEEAKWVEPGEDEEEEDEKEEEEGEKEEQKETDDKKDDSEDKKPESEKKEDATEGEEKKDDEDYKGIREFWLTAMKNVETIGSMIEPNDEPILSDLTEIKLLFSASKSEEESSDDDEMGFALEFHFSPNDYFTNSVLTKSYKIQCEPDTDDPFSFEGTEIVGCTGCSIDWKAGKNVTEKIVKKKQKHKGKGQTRVVTKTVKNDSFFNFFDPPKVTEEEDVDEDTEALLTADFEIGHFFRERLIPKAVLFFTGEAIEDDDDDDEFDEDDDEDDDELDEEDPDYAPPADGEKPQECKQQ